MQEKPFIGDLVSVTKRQLPLILLLNLPLVIVLCWIYWPLVNSIHILAWAGSMLMVMFSRLTALIYVNHHKIPNFKASKQQNILVINSTISGLLWGWAGFLFFVPERLDYQLIILLVIILKGIGSVSSIAKNLKAFYAYFPLSMMPITVLFLSQSDSTSVLLGVIAFFFVAIMLVFARNMSKTFEESLSIRYENQRLLAETEARKKDAEAASLAKTHFLAAASHDLRQPIHAMSLLINILEEGNTQTDTQKIVKQLRATSDSLQNLLNALLDISRLDAGVVEVKKQDVNLQTILQKLKAEFQLLAEQKGLGMNWPDEPISVLTDAALLEQILRNLFSNAIRYTQQGHISTVLAVKANQVQISVIDTGIGIDEVQQASIFDEFYQVGNQERDRQHGLGLGLAIVKRTINLLGSEISLNSQLNKGSRFTFNLPLSKQNIIHQKPKAISINNIVDDHAVVAVIEDDLQAAEAMQLLLESWHYTVITASHSDQLIKQFGELNLIPQVIISDFQLGDNRSGIKEIMKLQDHYHQKLPALLITGNIHAEQNNEFITAKLPVLYKPVAPAKLRAFIRSSVQTHT